jgi:hypothetical protein
MRVRGLLVTALLSVLLAETDVPAQLLTPLFPGWERYFEVSWEPFERRGRPQLAATSSTSTATTATRVKRLVESLDSAGRNVAQRVEWLGDTVPVFSRTYFEVLVPEPAPSYRVSVFAFDFIQSVRLESP